MVYFSIEEFGWNQKQKRYFWKQRNKNKHTRNIECATNNVYQRPPESQSRSQTKCNRSRRDRHAKNATDEETKRLLTKKRQKTKINIKKKGKEKRADYKRDGWAEYSNVCRQKVKPHFRETRDLRGFSGCPKQNHVQRFPAKTAPWCTFEKHWPVYAHM